MFIFTGNSVCQFSNPVFSIPVGQMKKKLFQRIIDRYTIGMQIPIDIPIPHRNPLALGIQQNTVLYSLIYRTKTGKKNEQRSRYSTSPTCVLYRNSYRRFINSSVCKLRCCSLVNKSFLPNPLHSLYILPIISLTSSDCCCL